MRITEKNNTRRIVTYISLDCYQVQKANILYFYIQFANMNVGELDVGKMENWIVSVFLAVPLKKGFTGTGM